MRSHSIKVTTVFLTILLFSVPGYPRKHGDVENIGNRNVSGRVFGIFPNWISLDREVELGHQISAEFEQSARLVEDPVIVEYVDRVGQNIVRHSDARFPFYIKVVDTDEVNAFAFPGGFFYINKGVILAAENESELVGVIAHEISHITARHATTRMSRAQYLQLAALPALFVGGYWAQMGIQNALGLGINLDLLGVTRESEREADQLGIQYLWNAGYDPNAFVSFFEKLQRLEESKPGRLSGWFRTHPSTDDRIVSALDEQRYLPEKDQYIVDTSEFQRIKARLQSIDDARRTQELQEDTGQRRPTLKRKTEVDGQDSGDMEDQDAQKSRPTLRRASDPPEE
jgi:beta-barrel assembly-enhancing protease